MSAFENMMAGFQAGTNLRRQREADARTAELNRLAQTAYGARGAERQQAIGQAVGVDAQAGMALDKGFADIDQRRNTTVANAAKMLMSAPEQYRASVYANMRGDLSQYIPNLPEQYDETVAQAAKSIVSAYGAGGEANNVQSRFINDNGEMVALMRDGSTRVVGKADPSMQIIEGDGGFYGVNRRSLQAAPVQLGSAPPAQPQRSISNIQYRTEDGQPIPPEDMAALQQAMQASASGQDVVIPVGGVPQFGGQLRKRSPEQEAAAVAQAKAAVEAQTAADIERQRVYGRQAGEAAANAEFGSDEARKASREAATKLPQLQNATRGVGRIRTALEALTRGRLGGLVDTGPADQLFMRYTPEGRELESAVGGIQNSVLALTRVPGVGSQSDLEARVAALQYPSLDNPPEVNARTLQNLEAFIADLQAAYDNVISSGSQQLAPRSTKQRGPAASGGRSVVRTGTLNGRRVVQYSDGTAEYAD